MVGTISDRTLDTEEVLYICCTEYRRYLMCKLDLINADPKGY